MSEQQRIVAERLKQTVEKLILNGYCYFGAGGALGFDTLAAECVLYLKSEDIAIYEQIKAQADKVVYTSEEYTRGCMFKRNRHLVDNSSICIAYLTESKGGTAYTVNYAKQKKIQVINLAEREPDNLL